MEMEALYRDVHPAGLRATVDRLAADPRPLGERCTLRLSLRSGQSLQGSLMRVDETKSGALVLVASGRWHEELTLVPLDQLAALTVCDLREAAHLLVEGVSRPLSAPEPTRLTVARGLNQRSAELTALFGHALRIEADLSNLSGPALANLQELGTALTEALAGVAADELGRAALGSVERVQITQTPRAAACFSKAGEALVLRVDLDGPGLPGPSLALQLNAIL